MYSLQISDFSTAGRVLGRAFQNDPIWITYAKNPEDRKSQLPAMFEFLTVMGFRYGSVWSPSEKLEGEVARGDGCRVADVPTGGLEHPVGARKLAARQGVGAEQVEPLDELALRKGLEPIRAALARTE